MTRIVCISDTHGRHEQIQLPEGDLLVHAGDLLRRGTLDELKRFDAWLAGLPHRHKVVIAGNHDWCFQEEPEAARAALVHATYLQDEGATLDGLRLWGSPWQPWFHDWAFNLPRGEPLRARWALIPDDVDVLVTHTPPAGTLDLAHDGRHAGCAALEVALATRLRPRAHIFGHIHEAYGHVQAAGTLSVNASLCDMRYQVCNLPVVIEV